MIDTILAAGNPVSAESEAWVRAKMSKIDRYRNLEPTISHFTIETYTSTRPVFRRYLTVVGWKSGRPIPLPKSKLKANQSPKTRVLIRLRKVIDHQVEPHRVKGLHVDHVYPFEAIVVDWMAQMGLSWDKVTSRHYPKFEAYHLKVAQYQLLTPSENIKKSNK